VRPLANPVMFRMAMASFSWPLAATIRMATSACAVLAGKAVPAGRDRNSAGAARCRGCGGGPVRLGPVGWVIPGRWCCSCAKRRVRGRVRRGLVPCNARVVLPGCVVYYDGELIIAGSFVRLLACGLGSRFPIWGDDPLDPRFPRRYFAVGPATRRAFGPGLARPVRSPRRNP
jgi:hypothetical protein